MDYERQRNKTIIFSTKNEIFQFDIEDIIYIKCETYISFVKLVSEDKHYSFCKSLKEIEEMLETYGFLRINNNILVNMKYLKHCKNKPKRCIVLKNGIELVVSRRKWWALKNYLNKSQ